MFEDAVKNVLEGNLTGDEILQRYNDKSYNKYILDILSISIQLNTLEELKEEGESPADTSSDSDEEIEIKNVLEEYYKIDECPSFLYYDKLLNNGDYKVGMGIYSKVFGMEYEDGCDEVMRQVIEEYIKRAVSGQPRWNSEEEMVDDLFI